MTFSSITSNSSDSNASNKENKPLEWLSGDDKEDSSEHLLKADGLEIRDILMQAAKKAGLRSSSELRLVDKIVNEVIKLDGAKDVFRTKPLYEENNPDSGLIYKKPPTEVPELWLERDKKKKETPVLFIQRVYGAWLGKGFTTSDLRNLDKSLYMAYYNQQKENSDNKVEDFNIPTKGEQAKKWVERVDESVTISGLSKILGKDGAQLVANTHMWKERHKSPSK